MNEEKPDFAVVIQLSRERVDGVEIVIQVGCRESNSNWIVFEDGGESLRIGVSLTFPVEFAKNLQPGLALALHHCPEE